MTPPQSPHVLVVDDERNLCEVLKARLESFGYTVSTVEDGLQAWQEVSTRTPDLILLDIRLPEEDGYTFLRKVRSFRDSEDPERERKIRQLPVIVITGTGEGMKSLFEQERISGYITKPIDSSVVRKLIEEILGRNR